MTERYGWDTEPTPDLGIDPTKASAKMQTIANFVQGKVWGKDVASAYKQGLLQSGIESRAALDRAITTDARYDSLYTRQATSDAKSTEAKTTANQAVTTANQAVTTANQAVTTASSLYTRQATSDANSTEAKTKANQAVTTANQAVTTANQAVTTANQAADKSVNTSAQLNTLVLNGDSSIEAAQARVDTKAYVHPTLKDRLDTEYQAVTAQLDLELTDYMVPSSAPTKAYVTFVDDDGTKAVLDKFLPIFSSKGVPCTLAVNVDNSAHSVPTMTKEEVKNLQDTYGWEIASHGYSHMNLENASNAGESTLRREIAESYHGLKSYGLNVKHLVYPYGAIDGKGQILAAKYFKSGTTAGGGIVPKPLRTFTIPRVPFGSYYATGEGTYASYKSKVDEAIADKKWLIFMLHAWTPTHDATQQQHLSDIIDYCLANNVEIVNLSDGYKIFGNKEEVVGEYVVTNQGEKVPLKVTGEYKMFDDHTVNIDTPPTYFKPYTETITQIHNNLGNAAGFPTNNGLLRTLFPWAAGGSSYVTQILTAYRGGMWYRTMGSSTWTDFYNIGTPKHAIVSTGTSIVVPANGYKAFNLSVPFAVTSGIPVIASPVALLGGQFTHSAQRNTGSSVSITVVNNAPTEANLGILEWTIKMLE